MAIELEDPFGEFDPSSLLSKTLAGTFGAKASVLDPEGLEPIRSIFESMAIKGYSTHLLEQAQTIVNSSTNLEKLYSEDGDGPIVANDKNRAQERRPALGRKRAKFSLKPMPSKSFPTIDVSSIDHIEDPEEYFSAVEQLENAEKELKKLRGETSTNLMQHPTTAARKRRPGLLGKTASYKHQFSAIDFTTEALVESQELKKSDGIVLNNVSHSETTNQCGTLGINNADNKLQDATERAGSVANEEEKTDNILEKLLSSFKGLNDDEGVTLLRENLQMKSIDVGKICLPDMGTIQKFDLKVLDSKVTKGQLKSSQFSKTSPILKESPIAGIAALHRRASLKDPLKDLYSVPPSDDESCSEDSSLSCGFGRKSLSPLEVDSHDQIGLVASSSFSPATENGVQLSLVDEMHLPLVQADGITSCRVTSDKQLESPVDSHDQSGLVASGSFSLATGNGVQLSFVDEMHSPLVQADGITSCIVTSEKQLPEDRSSGGDIDKDIVSSDLDGCLQEEHNNIQVDPSVFDHQDAVVGALNSGMENLARSPHRDMGGNCSSFGINNDTALGSDDTSHTKVYTTAEDNALSLQVLEDSSIPSKEIPAVNQNGFSSLRTGNDEGQQMASGTSPNRRNEKANRRRNQTVARRQNKKSSISRRQSLAGAGTFWDPESGRRKSSRARCKPLEYWRGERFLYGRIHESMTTIIGVKRASPGKPGLQVKSFVSPQYADLVAQAALH